MRIARHKHLKWAHYLSVLIVLSFTSCRSNKFSGDSNGGASPVSPTSTTSTTATTTTTVPPTNCVPGQTQISVKALTTQVDQYATNPVVQYELTLTDCPGTTPTAMANALLFDVNAVVKSRNGIFGFGGNLSYTVVVAGGSNTVAGTLQHKVGNDLFGHTGLNYGFYQTDQQVQFPVQNRKALVSVNISQVELVSPLGDNSAGGSTMVIDTYFKFGTSAAVTVPVTFTRKN